jgi:hypothetical protein
LFIHNGNKYSYGEFLENVMFFWSQATFLADSDSGGSFAVRCTQWRQPLIEGWTSEVARFRNRFQILCRPFPGGGLAWEKTRRTVVARLLPVVDERRSL